MVKHSVIESQPSVQWCSVPLHWSSNNSLPRLESNRWVQLLDLLNPYCHDEALLLCQESDSEWLVWIPDHGEAILNTRQFCLQVNY